MTKQTKVKVEFDPKIHGSQVEHLIRQCSDHKCIAESANEAFKDLKKQAKDEFGVDSKLFGQLFKIYHKDQREKFEDESEEVISVYDSIFAK